jgi:hypothetical protein
MPELHPFLPILWNLYAWRSWAPFESFGRSHAACSQVNVGELPSTRVLTRKRKSSGTHLCQEPECGCQCSLPAMPADQMGAAPLLLVDVDDGICGECTEGCCGLPVPVLIQGSLSMQWAP